MLAGECVMKARKLLSDTVLDPDELKSVCRVFDDAWEQVAPHVDNRSEAIEAARLKLAELILGLARNGAHDPGQLVDAAVKQMLKGPTTIGPKR
jgi:hypothetical protein